MQSTTEFIKGHKWEILISFIVGAFIIFIVSFAVGINDILEVLGRTNIYLMLFTVLLELIIILLWTQRWKLILDVLHRAPKFKQLFLMMFASQFGNNVTPGAAGGEPLRAYLLDKFEEIPFETGFASATADRVFEFFPFVLVSTLAAYLIFTLNIGFLTSLLVSLMIIVTMTFFGLMIYVGLKKEVATRLILSLAKRIYPFVKRLTSRETSFNNVKNKLVEYIETFTTGFQGVLRNNRMFLVGVFISFLMWGLDNFRFYLTFGAIGYYPPIVPMIIIYTISILVSILPTIPGSLGIREGTMVALFLPVGVPADVVLAVSLLDRLVTYMMPTFVGAFATFYYGKLYKDKKGSSVNQG
ncbi:MAG: UPF0104 family protein [Methanobacterium sp.]|uniref:UPF0104 family protein n=1 Tax=Methanobacterium sp. TaxID=2164 RepID=UPI003D6486C8|nr:UPF0104 family protein [Methanobacterium sp.]